MEESKDIVLLNKLIDTYVNLLRIKADLNSHECRELELQLTVTRAKLTIFNFDTSTLDKLF